MTAWPFHLAVPVSDLTKAREFYGGLLGCPEGRCDETWVDFDLFGHQFVCHLDPSMPPPRKHVNDVDGDGVPIPHFGVAFDLPTWRALADRLEAADIEFIIAPRTRFAGQPGEQGTMFFHDPFGHALEFKGFRSLQTLFAKEAVAH
ncbi:VOC family protein [Stratiformator vulcanicus]|uniref:Glyoxalase-like domain protein n=1 Tax=Stratiformator vulcanicus TaxID=2527980 RepID=A0A517QWY1_9PLAN|nr:VOC family protein [Stratiformator vulcanicus]QDT36078.1 Glyoxalase-like domain protein [Stratiformator vulcanicus]